MSAFTSLSPSFSLLDLILTKAKVKKRYPSTSIILSYPVPSTSRTLFITSLRINSLHTHSMSQAFYDDPESLLPEPSAYQQTTSADLDQRQGQYQEYIDEHGLTGAGVPQADDGEEERERLEGLKMALEQVPDEVKKVSPKRRLGETIRGRDIAQAGRQI